MHPFPWMVRDNPGYDPNHIGAISEAKIAATLIVAGKMIYQPCQVGPCDFLMEEEGKYFKIQCKTGRFFRGAIIFRSHRLRAARRETGWVRRVTDYMGEIDFFGVYCPEHDRVYLVPIKDVQTKKVCFLRVEPAQNNQSKKIRWAKDYEVIPLPFSSPELESFFDQE